jgi:hypothetical protein
MFVSEITAVILCIGVMLSLVLHLVRRNEEAEAYDRSSSEIQEIRITFDERKIMYKYVFDQCVQRLHTMLSNPSLRTHTDKLEQDNAR